MLERCRLAAQRPNLREGVRGVGTAGLSQHAALEGVAPRGSGELQQFLRQARRAVTVNCVHPPVCPVRGR